MKRFITICMTMLAVCMFTACSNDDDDEIFGTGLTGKWDLVEVLDGPEGKCEQGYSKPYPSGTVIIEFRENGKLVFNYGDGKVVTMEYSFPKNQEEYGTIYPVMFIDEVPFGYVIEGKRLKLHYYGNYFCDHIPATFVFRRVK